MNTWISIGLAAALVLVLGGLVWYVVRRRGRRGGIRHALKSVAVDHLEDVHLPDGMGGEIHVEHLVLTARGILVANVKRFEGVVFASDRMDEWAVISPTGRSAFPNPQGALHDRVAAVRQLVRDVAVNGYVLFPAGADFSKGRPKDVLLPDELSERYKKPDKAEIERHVEAYSAHWEKIRAAARPADTRPPRLT